MLMWKRVFVLWMVGWLGWASSALLAAEDGGAVKILIMIDVPDTTNLLALDRWYMRYHAPEMHRAMRAWQRNYLSYRSYIVPPGEHDYPVATGRLTEIHYSRLNDFYEGRRNNPYLDLITPTPGGWRQAFFKTYTAVVPVNPDIDYLAPANAVADKKALLARASATPPKDTPYFRWVMFLDYPESVAADEVERWYAEVHARELAKLPGLKRLVGYKTRGARESFEQVVELWFDDYASWKAAFVDARPALSRPSWSDDFPFASSQSIFVGENPDIDFITDRRVVP